MISSKLWRALNDPPALHPLFRRTVLLPPPPTRRLTSWAGLMVSLVMGLGEQAPTLLFIVLPFMLLIVGLTYGLDCSLRVSSAIAREHERGTFSLLSLSPYGSMGATWALCASAIYRNRDFSRLQTVVRGAVTVALVTIPIVGTVITLFSIGMMYRYDNYSPDHLIVFFSSLMILLVGLYLDYRQSAVLGCLVGMLIPTISRTRLDSTLLAFGVYLLLKITIYLLAFFVGFTLLPIGLLGLHLEGQYTLIFMGVARLGLLYIIQEGFSTLVWQILLHRLNAVPNEMDYVFRPAL